MKDKELIKMLMENKMFMALLWGGIIILSFSIGYIIGRDIAR